MLCGKIVDQGLIPAHHLGLVAFGRERCVVYLGLVPEARAGDYVLVENGCAFQTVTIWRK